MCQLGERWPGARVGRGGLVQPCARAFVLVQAATPAVVRIVVGLRAGMVTQSACVAG